MTRVEIRIDELVLRGFPEGYDADIAQLVTDRLDALATGDRAEELSSSTRDDVRPRASTEPIHDADALAELVARQIWSAATRQPQGAER